MSATSDKDEIQTINGKKATDHKLKDEDKKVNGVALNTQWWPLLLYDAV